MNKIVLFIFLGILMSCSSSDDSQTEDDLQDAYFAQAIIGSWAYDTVKINGDLFLYQHTDGCERDHFQFYNSDSKKFEFEERVVMNCSNCAPCATSQTGLEWRLKGEEIELYFGEALVLVYKIIEVNNDRFTYEVEVDYDEDGTLDLLEISGTPYDPYNEFD